MVRTTSEEEERARRRAARALAEATADGVKTYGFLRGHFADTVDELAEGSVVWQDLDVAGDGGIFEHSGIHVGGCEIVSLSGKGKIVRESTREFLEGGANRFIWVSCRGGVAVGKKVVAKRARQMVGTQRDYNFLFDNCHQFTSGCLTGDFESSDNFFWALKDTAWNTLRADNWRVWDRDGAIQRLCDTAIREIGADRRRLEKLLAADFNERKELLGASFERLEKSYAIKDLNDFLDGLAAIAKAYGGALPQFFESLDSFDDWILNNEDPAFFKKR